MALIAALLCVLANAFFVAAEFALAKVRPTALEARARQGDVASARALTIARQLDAYLTATQLGITLASLGLGWLGEPALAHLLEPPLRAIGASDAVVHGVALAVAFSVITMLHIVVGELVPKSLALQRPEDVARATAVPMRVFYWVIYPALTVLNRLSNLVLRLAGLPPAENAEGKLSLEELRLVVRASLGGQAEKQSELVERVLRSTDRPLRAVMVPRVDIVTIDVDAPYEAVLEHLRRHGYSRFPLAESGDPDRIVGYVYVKDVLMGDKAPRDGLRGLRRDVLYVPESITVGEVLEQFQRARIPIAVVLDEYGGTAGLVTHEDAVEEIVGEIQDELDVEGPRMWTREDGTLVVDGSLSVDDLELPGLDLPDREGGDTVGGYVVAALGRLARPGDRVRLGAWDAVVDDVRRRRVHRVSFVPASATMPPPAAPAAGGPDDGIHDEGSRDEGARDEGR
jgi:CBS domain containing-hemolysin-like protein